MEGYARYVTIFCPWIYVMSEKEGRRYSERYADVTVAIKDRPAGRGLRSVPTGLEERPPRGLEAKN